MTMQDAEKRLQKLAHRNSLTLKRAETMGLQVDYAALEQHIRKNFMNYGIEHQDFGSPFTTSESTLKPSTEAPALVTQAAANQAASPVG
ncbi:MAG: hypothetical protein P8144_02980 [Gammaproteobacteria bacterium]